MTFYDAINSLKDGYAAKTPAMVGYVKRTDIAKTDSDAWKTKFKVAFVERNGYTDTDSVSTYEFTHEIATDGTLTITAPTTDLSIDADLYKNFLRNDWSIVKTTDAEAANGGSSSLRW